MILYKARWFCTNNNIDNKYDNESEQLTINIGDTLYFARIIPTVGIYNVLDLKVRTVENDYFACIDKRDKNAFLFSYKDINNTIFQYRKDALLKVKEAEENKPKLQSETYYEEY